MKVPTYSKDGKKAGEVELPAVFDTPFRPDLIRKAVKVSRANRRQPYGASPVAGERHSTESIGKGRGMSRVPRLKQGRVAALAPNNVGGRRAHPPQARTDYSSKMNVKERRLAIASALGATARAEIVGDLKAFPIVVDDALVGETKTAKAIAALEAIGLGDDLKRAETGRHIRSGMGKLRGRRVRTPRSLLLVTSDGQAPAMRNLSGVDIVAASNLGAEHLAPGGDPGRLTVFTKSALGQIKEAFQ
jgi:large subunit ribosomal protein L4e